MSTTFTTGTRTLTALFDTRADAMAAVDELVSDGISRGDITVTPESDVSASSRTGTAYDASVDDKGFWGSLKDFFIPDDDRYTYAEAMHRGSVMVIVSADATVADRVEEILERRGTVDVGEREASWRSEGWTGYSAPAASSPGTSAGAVPRTRGLTDEGEEAIPEVEEQLRVGKRQVSSGRVKVRSYVVETPVSEQVNLRSESVRVERRPVDRAVTSADDPFQERTIEAVATSEEAVVSKEARVIGEVLVRKEADDRTETITDKVRTTKVEVEDDSIAGGIARDDSRRR